jgi:hypothetical protein
VQLPLEVSLAPKVPQDLELSPVEVTNWEYYEDVDEPTVFLSNMIADLRREITLLKQPVKSELTWSPVEIANKSCEYKDITDYPALVKDLYEQLEYQRYLVADLQLKIALLQQPVPTCETVNSDCQTDSEVALSECDTVSVKSEEEIVHKLEQVKKVTYLFRDAVTPITVENYSDKSFVVRGDTFEIKTKLAELGGKWNKFLTDKTTQKKFGGWVFSNSKRDIVEEFLNFPK